MLRWGGVCWGGSDVMRFGLEAWVRGETGGGERKYGKGGGGRSLICCVCLEKKGCLVLLLGCCSLGFVSV